MHNLDKPFSIPLRQRNAVNLRLAVVNAMKEKLRSTSLENIVVKPLCQELGIATATFFNHFPGKVDVLLYFIRLWTVRLEYLAASYSENKKGKDFIEALFKVLAADIKDHPRLMLEIIAYIARVEKKPGSYPIEGADLLLAWPELKGIEQFQTRDLGDIFHEHIREVVRLKKRSKKHESILFESLVSLFYGYPLTVKVLQIKNIDSGFERQLETIWRGHDL